MGSGNQTPTESKVSWMVLYEAATTRFYQSTGKWVSGHLQELCNYHATLKTIMGHAQNLDSGAEFEEFNGENSMTYPLPVYPLLIWCLYVIALLQATGDPRTHHPEKLEKLPSRYLERIPQIIEWISGGEREWIARYTDEQQESIADIHTWASELKDGLTRFDENARGFAAQWQTDIQTARQSLANGLSNSYHEGYYRVKGEIDKYTQHLNAYGSNGALPSATQGQPQ